MKTNTFLLPIAVACRLIFSAHISTAQIYYGGEANAIVPGSELVKMAANTGIPEFVKFSPGQEINRDMFDTWVSRVFKTDKDLSLELIKTEKDRLGFIHYRYRQLYKGLPIEWARYAVHEQQGKVRSVNGVIYNELKVNTIPVLSESKALEYALASIGAETYKWQVPQEEAFLKEETGDTKATYYPKGILCLLPPGENRNDFHLVYKFDIYAGKPLYHAEVYVDANSGMVLFENNRIQHTDAVGTAVTAYSGSRAITTDFTGTNYRLREAGRGNGIRTFDMNTGTNYGSAVDFTDADNFWNNVNANKDETATDAHWGAEMTYDYLLNQHARNSIDGNGFLLLSYVHYDVSYSNAFWDGTRMTYGDGSGSYGPFTALDIAGHEITHGLTENTANLVYSYQAGALNESFSDIFGTSVEFYGKPSQANWLVGENIGVTLRSMSNPNLYGDPDTYLGTNWYTGAGDNGGVHTNSGVQNFWYYLLTTGGSGTNDLGNSYNITGLGIVNAGAIAFRNLTVYLGSNSQYADARFYAIQSAIDLFGACSPAVIATTNAWYAVGVGLPFDSTVTSDFSANPASSCQAPFTVQFSNLSTNGGSFYWDFGDGNISTVSNPSHIYNTYGTFTVKLVTDGNPCGIDSITKVGYITVDSTIACVVIMPVSGAGNIQTKCTGTVYDNGGPVGTYADNTDNQITITPTGASTVTLTVISFDIEPGSGGSPPCDYDYVEFFNGPNTGSPSMGRYCNTTGPPAPLTSSGGSITIFHHADPAVNGNGFNIQWSCSMPNNPPSVNFTVNDTATCTGAVQFTDLSTNGPSVWNWNFGDGGLSTVQHPAYTYTSSGTYTVKLVATNGFGSDSLIKTSYITVTKPAAPAVISASRCGPGTVSLSATGTGTLNWYSDSSGTNLLGIGAIFTTPSITTTTNYYVQNVVIPASQYVGPVNNTIGAGANHTNTSFYEIFDCYSNFTLVSVKVYATGSGFRTIELRNSAGTLLQSTSVNIPDGQSRVTLNFNVTPGTNYRIATSGMSSMYRNSTGANYPYTLAGVVSITGNNIPDPNYYYYYYDWEVRAPICTSEPAVATATILQEPAANISSSTNITCFGICNGSASLTASGGSAPYSYLWSNAQTSSTIVSLCAGSYSVTVNDANGCTGSTSVTVTQPGAIVLTTGSTDANCGSSDGQATVVAANGITPYAYLWNDSSNQTTATATGLNAGTYSITVTDGNGCTSISSVVVNNTVPVVGITSSTNVTCNGGNNGQATALANSGTPPYTYIWNDPLAQTDSVATGLAAGTYSVTATDTTGCLSTNSVTITEPPAIAISFATDNASCTGVCNGNSTVSTTNGTGPFTYLWNDPGLQTTVAANGLCAGTFSITVTDALGCNAISNTTVSNGAGITVNLIALTNTTCGVCGGDASVSASTGSAPYTYLWNDPGLQSTATATGLCAGSFDVVVTDAVGCTNTTNVQIFDFGGVFANISSSTNVSCSGGNDGQATASGSGGGAPYLYSWNDPLNQTNATAAGLAAGAYTATVTDTNGCISTSTVVISQPGALASSIGSVYPNCGSSNGSAYVSITGGTAPYSYQWNDPLMQTGDTATGLASGSYSVTITDANGCSDTATVALGNTGGPAGVLVPTSVSCNGGNNGEITASVSGGTAPYTYLWNDPLAQTNATATGLMSGTYTVTITDVTGCAATGIASVSEPAALVPVVTSTDASCGNSDGSASVSVTGGTVPYSYQWNDPSIQTTAMATGLPAGNYQIIVIDGNGCMDSAIVMVNNTGAPSVLITPSNVTCNGGSNGMAATSIIGGAFPFTYLWNDPAGQTTAVATGLLAGNYTLTVTDSAGCITSSTTTVTEPPALLATAIANDAAAGTCTGSASVNASGGTPPYTYLWSNGNTSTSISGLCPNTYTVTVTDGNGCAVTAVDTVNAKTGIGETGLANFVKIYPNPSGGSFVLEFTVPGLQDVSIKLYTITGQIAYEEQLMNFKGPYRKLIHLHEYAKGIYTLRVVSDGFTGVKKVVFE